VSGTDNLHAAASNRPCPDDLTFHSRGILSQVEWWRRFADRPGRFSCEWGRRKCDEMAAVAMRSLFMAWSILACPTSLDEEQTRSAS